jgi:hypothetical protein
MALLFAAGCTEFQPQHPFSRFDPEGVRRRMTDLVNRNQFQEARDITVKSNGPDNPQKSPEESMKERLIETLVNPAEAKFTAARILALKAQVTESLERNDDESARQAIYNSGITDQKAVNTVVFISKCHYLNTLVNPATLAKWEQFAKHYVDGAIKAGDYRKAAAAARRIPCVEAYPERIDELVDEAGEAAVEQHADEVGVAFVDRLAKAYFYKSIAKRDGTENNPLEEVASELKERAEALMPDEKFIPDWKLTKIRLARLMDALLADDVGEEDAEDIVATLLEAYKALVAEDKGLSTFELNMKLAALRLANLQRVASATEEALKKADGARVEELKKAWMAIAGMIAEEVDTADRERAMLAAISDRAEPGIRRVLGDGCRALRLYRTYGKLTSKQATGLFVAAVYMGFDDMMDLAMALGADINGASERDTLGRSAYLVALQFGFKGRAAELLAGADPKRRDAMGFGAVHYAVRGGDTKVLLSLLQKGLDARSAASDGTTPLMLAAIRRNGAMVQMLLGGSDVGATDAKGYTALHHAAEQGDLDIVKALVGVDAAMAGTTAAGDTVLSLAVRSNSEDLLEYLLDEVKLPTDERAVSRCVIEGWLWPLKMLVAHGGKVTDKHLAVAVKCGQFEMVKWLVEHGCDVNAEVVHAVAPLLRQSTGEKERDIWRYLLSQGYWD